ncbi:PKD domain-containing protein (plasmid) [Deinococcus psychrotolerans]|uniref:PKD domain-containing protein n=1 Tax=Deinococcus psychrotolerans TaxID=2489213 RepID=A0A3G8YJI2_9DEIO|nr:PKD domain-containing protein [Deinococcus psychrotolerans]AZI44457.1 PKD domain-containing protein [Deinococcus psychrotolerans]
MSDHAADQITARQRFLARSLTHNKAGTTMNKTLKTALVPALLLSAALSLAGCSTTTPPSANHTPVANFTFMPAALTVSTTNTSSDADAGDTLMYDWDWGDGSPHASAASPSHTYTAAATYPLTLKTTDNHGASNTKTVNVTVTAPVAGAPTILSVSPTNASLGNVDSTSMVVTFSEPMDTISTQAAYNSASVGIRQAFGEVTYSWSPDHKVLTIIPNTPLNYAIAPAAANNYTYYISTAAKSAAGVFLASQYNTSFKTYVKHLNEVHYSDFSKDAGISGGFLAGIYTVTPPALSMTIGDDALNSTQAAYLTFDLSSLPASVQPANMLAADLKVTPSAAPIGAPYTTLNIGPKMLTVQGLVYGNSVDITELLPMNELASNLNGTIMNADVLGEVKTDWINRAAQSNLSQYQLRFAQITASAFLANQAYIFSGDPLNTTNRPKLTLTYLADN